MTALAATPAMTAVLAEIAAMAATDRFADRVPTTAVGFAITVPSAIGAEG
jgi:hypothetical protein